LLAREEGITGPMVTGFGKTHKITGLSKPRNKGRKILIGGGGIVKVKGVVFALGE